MRTLNLGVLAHVDAGKTTLTERLLHAAGVIDEVGSVDHGSTRTDTLAQERRRGITIKAAVVSFAVDDVVVNLVDTPGHPDFIAEVERVLGILDGAVLVVSAVEGVQPQTVVLMRALRRLRIPTLVFVNKADRMGADVDRVLEEVASRLTPASVPMGAVSGLGTPAARWTSYGPEDAAYVARLTEVVSEHDDAVLAAYVDGEPPSYELLLDRLRSQTARCLVHPVFVGSAMTGAGVSALHDRLATLLPTQERPTRGGPVGRVFKVSRGPAGERIGYVAMIRGRLSLRDRVRTPQAMPTVTRLAAFEEGETVVARTLEAGRIGMVWGLGEIRVGDAVGEPFEELTSSQFAAPTLESVVVPRRATDRGALHLALSQLAEQDPLIDLRTDDLREEAQLALYGEVQKEVIRDTLAEEFGLEVEFRASTPLCIERPCGVGAWCEELPRERSRDRPYLAGLGLRVGPGPVDGGLRFRLEIERGSLPRAFRTAIEVGVERALLEGLRGWPVVDCEVVVTHSGYWARQSHVHATFDKAMSSTGDDFRAVAGLVVKRALALGGTTVLEPVHRFHLEAPAESLGPLLAAVTRLGGVPDEPAVVDAALSLEGTIPVARLHALRQELPTLSKGEGLLESRFDGYQPIVGTPAQRPRRRMAR